MYQELTRAYDERKALINARLREFDEIRMNGDDNRIFEELAFCILTSAVGPIVGIKSLNAIKGDLICGNEKDLQQRLEGVHKYPEKSAFIVHTRDYLKSEYEFKLSELINSFDDPQQRRDFFALNKNIKGLGLTQASHFLRNIGFKGYAILDRNVIRTLHKYGVIEATKPPASKKKYLEIEQKMNEFAVILGITIDELDLLLWSMKSGRVPK